MTVQPEQGINHELSLGENISKTFQLYRKDFPKYFVLFAIVGVITGVLTALAQSMIIIPTLPANPTSQQLSDWFPRLFGAIFLLIGLIFIVSVVFTPIAQGGAIKLASEQIEKGQASLEASVKATVSRLPWIWALSIVVGIIVFLGFIVLIIPGIILAIMFSLTLPVLLIENKRVFDSMSRSRELVGHRWGKTFAIFLVMGIIVIIASLIVSTITAPLGIIGPVVNGIVSAFFQPLLPILSAVYYYSNRARIAAPPAGMMPTAPTTMPQAGTTFCPSCGAPLAPLASFCSKCGARLS